MNMWVDFSQMTYWFAKTPYVTKDDPCYLTRIEEPDTGAQWFYMFAPNDLDRDRYFEEPDNGTIEDAYQKWLGLGATQASRKYSWEVVPERADEWLGWLVEAELLARFGVVAAYQEDGKYGRCWAHFADSQESALANFRALEYNSAGRRSRINSGYLTWVGENNCRKIRFMGVPSFYIDPETLPQ
jgi:hypothetical protein